jgi:hypothetical protein
MHVAKTMKKYFFSEISTRASIGTDPTQENSGQQQPYDGHNEAGTLGPLPNAYASRGHKCLDSAYATPGIFQTVAKAGYEAFNPSKNPTDHPAYYVNFKTDKLF